MIIDFESHSNEGIEAYHCEICNRAFAREGTLKWHINSAHGQKNHKCETCNKFFKYAGNLRNHIVYDHEGLKCGKVFSLANNSNIDNFINENVENLNCEIQQNNSGAINTSPNQFNDKVTNQKSSNGSRTRKKRFEYTREQIEHLEMYFRENEYVDKKQKTKLSQLTNIPETQIKWWFKNRRAKKMKESRPIKNIDLDVVCVPK